MSGNNRPKFARRLQFNYIPLEMTQISITFNDGMLWVDGDPGPFTAEDFLKRHPLGKWITPAYQYSRLLEACRRRGISVDDRAPAWLVGDAASHHESLDPFDFQREAVEAWSSQGRQGIIVLPTGAGKSFMTRMLIGRVAIERAGYSALVVVPTRALLYQWHRQLHSAFNQEIGIVGDDFFDLRPLTVTTYVSARNHMARIGNRWRLVVYDEIHRKIGRGRSLQAAFFCLAPLRLALTATPVARESKRLTELIGPRVYERTTDEMIEREILSVFERRTVHLRPTAEEIGEFRRLKEPMERVWRRAKEAHRVHGRQWLAGERSHYPDEVALAQRSALQAVRYWQSVPSRMARLGEILVQHPLDRILIFTESRRLAYEISRRFLLPPVTADIDQEERDFYLAAFGAGKCRALVTAKALEEGIDLPEANVAIILAGGRRSKKDPVSYIQRRGRILRKRLGKRAIVYEISWAAP